MIIISCDHHGKKKTDMKSIMDSEEMFLLYGIIKQNTKYIWTIIDKINIRKSKYYNKKRLKIFEGAFM